MKLFKKKATEKDEIKRLKGSNIRLQIELAVMFFLLLALFLFNYNYTVFKLLIACGYTDTDTLDAICSDTLGEDIKGNYLKNFDNVTIELFTENIREENGDEYIYLYKKGELNHERTAMKEDGSKTTFEMINKDTGLFTMTTFSSSSFKNIKESLREASGCKTLIFDLRNNPGGDLKYADKTAELFLPEGSIIAQYNYRSKFLSKTVVSENNNPVSPEKIYILQDENTASSAEVFINALKENLPQALIIGNTSYGKGVGQVEMKLLNGYGIKATAIEILTPKGNCINHTGITPDIETTSENALDTALNLSAEQ